MQDWSPLDMVAKVKTKSAEMTRRNSQRMHPEEASRTSNGEDLALFIAPLLRARGVSVPQFTALLRRASVQYEASLFNPTKINKARIAFSTDLPRSAVSALLVERFSGLKENHIQALVRTWRSNPYFLDKGGRALDLPLFGKGKSFEKLVKIRGKGLPVRAILDELADRDAILMLPAQMVRLQQSFPNASAEFWRRLTGRLASQVKKALSERSAPKLKTAELCLAPTQRTHFKRQRR